MGGLDDYQIYYDRQGRPISRDEAIPLFEERPLDRRVAYDEIGDVTVSTVHLVINHQFDPTLPPLIFETMIFGGPFDMHQWRYATEAEAIAKHDQILAAVRDGIEPDQIVALKEPE